MASESSVSDTPFPGARLQVRGAFHREPTSAAQRSLALESSARFSERGWSVRLPVRAEKISIDKQAVVYERVVVRRRAIEERARVQANVRREELWVSAQKDENVHGAAARQRAPRICAPPTRVRKVSSGAAQGARQFQWTRPPPSGSWRPGRASGRVAADRGIVGVALSTVHPPSLRRQFRRLGSAYR